MALYKLNESTVSYMDAQTLLESLEIFVLKESGAEVIERDTESLTKELEAKQKRLEDYDQKIKDQEAELKKIAAEKPKSWLERKLESFQAAIERFEEKYKLTKDNKSKGIIKKILSVLTRIVKWINEKLLQATRWVGNKFFKREEKIKSHQNRLSNADLRLRGSKAGRGSLEQSIDSTKRSLENAKKNNGKTKDYKMTGKPFKKDEFEKIMTDPNGRLVF